MTMTFGGVIMTQRYKNHLNEPLITAKKAEKVIDKAVTAWAAGSVGKRWVTCQGVWSNTG